MKYLKKFENFTDNYELKVQNKGIVNDSDGSVLEPMYNKNQLENLYDFNWKKELPEMMTINYHGEKYTFKKGNVMVLADSIEATYESYPKSIWGSPDCLEFDFYLAKDEQSKKIRTTVDITYGDLMACEFSIENPDIVNLIQYTSYHSKFDPSNTVFALEDESLDEFINFLNKFPKMKLRRNNFKFLDKYDNYNENNFNNIIDFDI